MSLADELKKLEELRWNGTLTDEEFARAKAAILAGLEKPLETTACENADADVSENLAAQLAEVRYQNELARIDREWEQEKEKYTVAGKHGRRHIPTQGEGLMAAFLIGGFGIFWTVMALGITSRMPNEAPFAIAGCFFPLFGIVFTGLGIYQGVSAYQKAEAYTQAFTAYKQRRAAVKPENFR